MKTVYYDASVPLRWLFRQPGFLNIEQIGGDAVTSRLARAECWRTLDRRRSESGMDDDERALREARLTELFESVEELELSRAVLARAAAPLPSPVGTLDAIHLATALIFREITGVDLEFATHDRELAQAARLHRFPVMGV